MNIDNIKNDGFFIKQYYENTENIGVLTLTISLKSYFSTYNSIKNNFSFLKNDNSEENQQHIYNANYIKNASEAIFHIQHYLELYVKEILKKESNIRKIDRLGFSVAYNKLCELIKKNGLVKYNFISDAKTWVTYINTYRNKIAHSGVYVIRYIALDYLFGKYILPFLEKVFKVESKESRFSYLKFKSNSGNKNILNELINHFKNEQYNISKIALLKEFGRAGFENPNFHKLFDDKYKETEKANELARININSKIIDCPICEYKTLIQEFEYIEEFNENGATGNDFPSVYKVKCNTCSLEIYHNLDNTESMNLDLNNLFMLKE